MMKKILLATAALALLGPSIASAQQSQDQRQWRGRNQTQGQPQPQAQPAAPARGAQTQPDWNAYMRNNPDLQKDYAHNRTTPGYTESQQAYAERHYREHGKAEGRALPQEAVTAPQQTQAQQRQQWSGDNRQSSDARQGDRNWNGDRNRTGDNAWRGDRNRTGDNAGRGDRGRQDWRSDNRFRNYERNYSAQRHYRFGRYERPRGWYARRWTFGEFLPSLFWSQNYWIYDYSAFGLPYPPPGCVWVRYGDDALLIDRYTGEIIQVVYSIFY
jgi:Ni/Co efflux regulator RcnB